MNRRSAFTLLEILIAIGIIALLVAILIPAIGLLRNSASQTTCLSNVRQLAAASFSYASDNDGLLPSPNFPGKEPSNIAGWLYVAPIQGPPAVESQLESGVLYGYLHNHKVYHCPQDEPEAAAGPARIMSSYTMNGAVIGYGSAQSVPFRFTRMAAGGVEFWEGGDGPSAFAGGGTTPDAGPTSRHGNSAAVSFFDGHAERWPRDRFGKEQTCKPGSLWCNPQIANGTGTPTGY